MKKLAFLSSLVLALGLAIGCSSGSNWVDPSIPQPIVGTEAVEISETLIAQWGNAQIGVTIPLADFGITDVSFDDGATYIISGTLTADVTFKGMYMQNTKDWSDNAPVVLTDTIAPNVKDFSREWKGIPGVTAFQFVPQADSSLVGEKVKFTISNFKIELKEAPADTGSGSGGISSYTYISNIEIADVKDENGAKRISGNQYATFKIGTGVFKAGDKLIFGFAEAPKGVNFIFVDNDTADSDITDNDNWFGWKQATDTTSGIHYINLDKATYEYTFTKDTFVTREVDFAGNKKNVSHDVSFQLQNNDSTALLTAAIYIPAASNTAGAGETEVYLDKAAAYDGKWAANQKYNNLASITLDKEIPAGTKVKVSFTAECALDVSSFNANLMVKDSWSPTWGWSGGPDGSSGNNLSANTAKNFTYTCTTGDGAVDRLEFLTEIWMEGEKIDDNQYAAASSKEPNLKITNLKVEEVKESAADPTTPGGEERQQVLSLRRT